MYTEQNRMPWPNDDSTLNFMLAQRLFYENDAVNDDSLYLLHSHRDAHTHTKLSMAIGHHNLQILFSTAFFRLYFFVAFLRLPLKTKS